MIEADLERVHWEAFIAVIYLFIQLLKKKDQGDLWQMSKSKV